MFITVDSKPLITAGFGPSASKVVGNKNGHHHRLDITIGSCYKLAVIRIFKNSKIRSKIVKNVLILRSVKIRGLHGGGI
jgi:hypothetical protein